MNKSIAHNGKVEHVLLQTQILFSVLLLCSIIEAKKKKKIEILTPGGSIKCVYFAQVTFQADMLFLGLANCLWVPILNVDKFEWFNTAEAHPPLMRYQITTTQHMKHK